MRPVLPRLLVLLVLALGAAGCGDGDDAEPAAPAPTTTTREAVPPATSAPDEPRREKEPRRERTPASLADCIRVADGVSEVLVKGRDSEDARFFSDLAGGRVDVLGVTLEGQPTEVTVALFGSPAAAREAAPAAGGGGVDAETVGSAVVLAPPGASTGAVEGCLRETGYAGS